MKKRGQSTQQVFIFILAIIIVGIILLAGYTSIKRSSEKQEQALETFLVRSLKNTIASVSPNYAAMKIKEFETPSRYSEICFIDTNDPSEHSSEFLDNYPLIEDALETENNAFLIGKRFNSFDVGKLLLDNHAICINISDGDLGLKVVGLGDKAKICPIDQDDCMPSSTRIICSNNADCGIDDYTGTPFCLGDNVYQDYVEYLCTNPGTTSSSCSSDTSQQLKQVCLFGCLGSSCLTGSTPPGTNTISNCEELQNIRDDVYADYSLINNIDCTETQTWDGGKGFEPIPPFSTNQVAITMHYLVRYWMEQ